MKELGRFHEKYALVPTDKACYNIAFLCKAHNYSNCIINEIPHLATHPLLQDYLQINGILQSHVSGLNIFISQSIGQMNVVNVLNSKISPKKKLPVSNRYSTKPLPILLTKYQLL